MRQLNQIKAEQEEHAVIRTANDTNETAKEVKVVASQTDKPLIVSQKSTGSQSPQLFDMTVNDNMSKVKQDIESVENTQQQNRQQQEQNISRILQNHLQHEATPDTTTNFAHKMASSASSGIKKAGSMARGAIQQLSSSSSQEPINTSLLLGDGMGKQDWYSINPPQLNLGEKPKFVPQPKPTPTKRKTIEDEYDDLMVDVEKSKPKPKPKPKPTPKPSVTASAPPPPKVTKTISKNKNVTTGTQIPPSKIGIQKLREELENAKNKDKLSVSDTSAYMKLYDDWKGAKGDKAMKYEKLKGLRDIYKRVLYKK